MGFSLREVLAGIPDFSQIAVRLFCPFAVFSDPEQTA